MVTSGCQWTLVLTNTFPRSLMVASARCQWRTLVVTSGDKSFPMDASGDKSMNDFYDPDNDEDGIESYEMVVVVQIEHGG